MNLYSTKDLTDLLERNQFFFKKNLGQNFLLSEAISMKIATTAFQQAVTDKKKLCIEIGPGAGSLTYQLSKLFDQVLAIEIDTKLIPVLEESLKDCENVVIHNTDALKFDFQTLTELYPDYEYCVCSNLPYYITSELIMRFLECKIHFTSITVLIQKEAAERLIAQPNSPNFGAITASVSYYAKAKKCFQVSPGNFIPRPKVDSAVLQLLPHQTRPITPLNEQVFFSVIRAAFAGRRKTLANTLSNYFADQFSKEQILKFLEQSQIDQTRRGETLTLQEFCSLADNITNFEEK